MREIVAITHSSLDGVVQSPGEPEEDTRNGFRHGGWPVRFRSEATGVLVNTERLAGTATP